MVMVFTFVLSFLFLILAYVSIFNYFVYVSIASLGMTFFLCLLLNSLKLDLSFALFVFSIFFYLSFSSFFSEDVYVSLKSMALYFSMLTMVLFCYSSLSDNHKNIFLKYLILTYCITYVAFVVLAAAAVLFGTSVVTDDGLSKVEMSVLGINIEQVLYGSFPNLSVGGVTPNPNTFGMLGVYSMMLVTLFPYLMSQSVMKAIVLVSIYGVFLSFSSASLGMLFLYGFVYLFVSHSKYLFLLMMMFTVLFLFMDVGPTSMNLELSSRDVIWEELMTGFYDKFLFGHGFSSSTSYLKSMGFPGSAHNLYVMIAYELGVIGLAMLLLMMLYTLFLGFEGFTLSSDKEYYMYYSLFMLVFYLSQFFEVFLFSSQLMTCLWFFMMLHTRFKLKKSLINPQPQVSVSAWKSFQFNKLYVVNLNEHLSFNWYVQMSLFM